MYKFCINPVSAIQHLSYIHTYITKLIILSTSFNTNTFRENNISERHFSVEMNVLKKKVQEFLKKTVVLMQWPVLRDSQAVIKN